MRFTRRKQYRSVSFSARQHDDHQSKERDKEAAKPPTPKIQRLIENPSQNEDPDIAPRDLRVSFLSFGPLYFKQRPLLLAAKEEALQHVYTISANQVGFEPEEIKEAFLMAMRNIDNKARDAYTFTEDVDEISNSDFRLMMIIDGCFFIQLAVVILGGFKSLGHPQNHVIFGDKDFVKWCDAMFYVGNQIPVLVLQELMKQTFFQEVIKSGTWHSPSSWSKKILYNLLILPSLESSTKSSFCWKWRYTATRDNKGLITCDILQSLRDLVLGPQLDPEAYDIDDSSIDLEANGGKRYFLKATKLRQKGVKIKPLNEGVGSRGIYFKESVFGAHLYLPIITVEDDMEVILRHLKSYEMNMPLDNKLHRHEVCSYIGLMSDILRTPKDVEVLANEGVIMGTRRCIDKLPGILRRLDCNVTSEHLNRIQFQVGDYQGPEWHTLLKNLLSLVVFLTVVQTFYAILSYHHPNSKS